MSAAAIRLLLRHRAEEPLLVFCRALCAAVLLQVPVVPTEALLLVALLPCVGRKPVSYLGILGGFALLAAVGWLLLGCMPITFLPYLCLPVLLQGAFLFRRTAIPPVLRAVLLSMVTAQCSLAPAFYFSFFYDPSQLMGNTAVLLSAGVLFLSPPMQRLCRRQALSGGVLPAVQLFLLALCTLCVYKATADERPLYVWFWAEGAALFLSAVLRRHVPRVWFTATCLPLIAVAAAVLLYTALRAA